MQATPTYQPSRMLNKDLFNVQSVDRITIFALHLLEKHSIYHRNECRCYLTWCSNCFARGCKNLENSNSSRMTYEYPTIVKLIDL